MSLPCNTSLVFADNTLALVRLATLLWSLLIFTSQREMLQRPSCGVLILTLPTNLCQFGGVFRLLWDHITATDSGSYETGLLVS